MCQLLRQLRICINLMSSRSNVRWRPARNEQLGQGRKHVVALELARDRQRQALPARLVGDRQDPEFAALVGATLDEVVGPDMPRTLGPKPGALPVVHPHYSQDKR